MNNDTIDVSITHPRLTKEAKVRVFFIARSVIIDDRFQKITTCGIRSGKSVDTYWGNAILNPNDSLSDIRGKQVAFKRAFLNLAQSMWGVPVNEDRIDMKSAAKYGKVNLAKNADLIYDQLRKAMYEAGAWK